MKVHTTNYKNSFIAVSEDISIENSEIPPVKRNKTLANIQYEMITKKPYEYTSDDVLFECFAQKNDITESDRKTERVAFFSKVNLVYDHLHLEKDMALGFILTKIAKLH